MSRGTTPLSQVLGQEDALQVSIPRVSMPQVLIPLGGWTASNQSPVEKTRPTAQEAKQTIERATHGFARLPFSPCVRRCSATSSPSQRLLLTFFRRRSTIPGLPLVRSIRNKISTEKKPCGWLLWPARYLSLGLVASRRRAGAQLKRLDKKNYG